MPRHFLVEYRDRWILFDCAFDDALDDYPDDYTVFVLPDAIKIPQDWTCLHELAERKLGNVLVQDVRFDPTKRKSIDASVLNGLPS